MGKLHSRNQELMNKAKSDYIAMGQNFDQLNDSAKKEKMMNNLSQWSQYVFELEEKREQSIISQSNQMLTAFSVFTAALLMVIPILFGKSLANSYYLLDCVWIPGTIVFFLIIVSFVLTILAQWRFQYITMKDATELANETIQNNAQYNSQTDYDAQWLNWMVMMQRSRKKNNDLRVKLLSTAMVLFIAALIIVTVTAVYLLLWGK